MTDTPRDPDDPPPFQPTMPTADRMLVISEVIVAAAEGHMDGDRAAVEAAFARLRNGGELRMAFIAAAGSAVAGMQMEAAERGAGRPTVFTVSANPTDVEAMAQAAMNAASTGDGAALWHMAFSDDLVLIGQATSYLTAALGHTDKMHLLDEDGPPPDPEG